MSNFPIGLIILIIICIVIYFGAAERVLDRMRMKDRTAVILIGLMIAGSFIDVNLSQRITINIGGVVTVGVAVYLWAGAGTWKERIRSLLAALATALLLYFLARILGAEPEAIFIDPIYLYPIVAGIMGYLAGRSRRGAFFAAVMGVFSLDVLQYFYLVNNNIPGRVHVGGAGAFDSLVVSGILAVLLAEIIGEIRERMQGGPSSEGRPEELLMNLKGKTEIAKKPPREEVYARGQWEETRKEPEDIIKGEFEDE